MVISRSTGLYFTHWCSRRRTRPAAAQSAACGALSVARPHGQRPAGSARETVPRQPRRSQSASPSLLQRPRSRVWSYPQAGQNPGDTPNFIIPTRTYDANDPYVALVVNTDWYDVQSRLAPEVSRLAPYIPGLDAQVEAARQAAAPEPEQELNPAEPDAGAEEE